MLYREAGDFKSTYSSDNQTFPIRGDRYAYWVALGFAFLVVPFFLGDYWANSIVIPFLIYVIAALGLNLLIGYCGQLSLGTAAFMAVGAYATFKLTTSFPGLNIYIVFLLSGLVTAGVGVLFGLPLAWMLSTGTGVTTRVVRALCLLPIVLPQARSGRLTNSCTGTPAFWHAARKIAAVSPSVA